MKKNLLTLMFVLAFICVGVSVASAKNSSSSKNSVGESKATVNKIKALRAKCKEGQAESCANYLVILGIANSIYEYFCAPDYASGCAPAAETALLIAADAFESCVMLNGGLVSENIDRKMDLKNKYRKSLIRNG